MKRGVEFTSCVVLRKLLSWQTRTRYISKLTEFVSRLMIHLIDLVPVVQKMGNFLSTG